MTGKQLIDLIKNNDAENLQIMLIDADGGMSCWHYPATDLQIYKVNKNDEHFSSFDGNEYVAVIT